MAQRARQRLLIAWGMAKFSTLKASRLHTGAVWYTLQVARESAWKLAAICAALPDEVGQGLQLQDCGTSKGAQPCHCCLWEYSKTCSTDRCASVQMPEELWDGFASKLAGTHSFGPVLYPSSMTQRRAHAERITCDALNGHAMTSGRANTKMALAVRGC